MTVNQIYIFFVFIIDGILIGLLFDFFRILRKSFVTSNFITYLEDILFWVLTGIIIIYTLYIVCSGEIRIYMFLGLIIGILIYILTISKYIIKFSIIIINIFKKIIYTIFKPIVLVEKFIYNNIIKKILSNNFLQKNIKKTEKKEGF